MMQKLRNPKNVKFVSLFVAAIFVLGCFALTLSQSGMTSSAAAATSESAIGVVNYQAVISQSPELAAMQEAMQAEVETAKKDFAANSANMNDAEKERYYKQLQERLANKQEELMEPVLQKAEAAIQKVADKKGLSVVVEKSTVVFGGVDITEEVVKNLHSGK